MGIYDGLLRVYRNLRLVHMNLRLVHMNLRLVHMNLRLVHMNALCFSSIKCLEPFLPPYDHFEICFFSNKIFKSKKVRK